MASKRTLHIVQGGVLNGDKDWLDKAAKKGLRSLPTWVVPKAVEVGDDVVVYIGGYGFYATARIGSPPRSRRGWPNRYGSALEKIRLITPAISLPTIRRRIPQLRWAIYPRSITTPTPHLASRIKSLIAHRRRTRMPDLSVQALETANIDELRKVALMQAVPSAVARKSVRLYRARSQAIRLYVLRRANGICEGCQATAPFRRDGGSPYLEPHHVARLADDGPDHPAKVIALCPNCHRRAHHAANAKAFNQSLINKLPKIEAMASDGCGSALVC